MLFSKNIKRCLPIFLMFYWVFPLSLIKKLLSVLHTSSDFINERSGGDHGVSPLAEESEIELAKLSSSQFFHIKSINSFRNIIIQHIITPICRKSQCEFYFINILIMKFNA